MEIFSVRDERFRRYGKVWDNIESTKLVKGIVARELCVRPNELGPATGRAPMRPIEMKVLARDKEETK